MAKKKAIKKTQRKARGGATTIEYPIYLIIVDANLAQKGLSLPTLPFTTGE